MLKEIEMVSYESLVLCFNLDIKSLSIMFFPLILYKLNGYELTTSYNLFIIFVAHSLLCKAVWV